jgi:hypothetical protein
MPHTKVKLVEIIGVVVPDIHDGKDELPAVDSFFDVYSPAHSDEVSRIVQQLMSRLGAQTGDINTDGAQEAMLYRPLARQLGS